MAAGVIKQEGGATVIKYNMPPCPPYTLWSLRVGDAEDWYGAFALSRMGIGV